MGIEVKAAAGVSSSDFRGIIFLAEARPDQFHRGVVLYTGKEPANFARNMHALPMSALWRW